MGVQRGFMGADGLPGPMGMQALVVPRPLGHVQGLEVRGMSGWGHFPCAELVAVLTMWVM